jgi:hypothetical protein
VDQCSTVLGGEGVSFAQPSSGGVGPAFSYPFGVGGFPPSFQWILFPLRLFSLVYGCSPQFLHGMSWRDQQSSWVFEVGESSMGDDLERGVVVPRVVQDARSCFCTMGISFNGTERGFPDFLTLVDEGQRFVSAPKQKGKREVKNLECSINFDLRVLVLAGLEARG